MWLGHMTIMIFEYANIKLVLCGVLIIIFTLVCSRFYAECHMNWYNLPYWLFDTIFKTKKNLGSWATRYILCWNFLLLLPILRSIKQQNSGGICGLTWARVQALSPAASQWNKFSTRYSLIPLPVPLSWIIFINSSRLVPHNRRRGKALKALTPPFALFRISRLKASENPRANKKPHATRTWSDLVVRMSPYHLEDWVFAHAASFFRV